MNFTGMPITGREYVTTANGKPSITYYMDMVGGDESFIKTLLKGESVFDFLIKLNNMSYIKSADLGFVSESYGQGTIVFVEDMTDFVEEMTDTTQYVVIVYIEDYYKFIDYVKDIKMIERL